MSVVRLAVFMALVAALFPTVALAQSTPSCRFAHGGSGQTLSVAVRGTPGLLLSVDWGDGKTSVVQQALSPGRDRAYLTHDYAAMGRYRVTATAITADGRGCGAEFYPDIPFTVPVSAANRQLLPEPGAPRSSDLPLNVELGTPRPEAPIAQPPGTDGAEVGRPLPVRLPQITLPDIGGALQGVFDWLWGTRR